MTAVKTFVVAMIALLIGSLGSAAPAGAVDQCAPPGVESASALPTNLAAAAQGPGADKYTTATVAPLSAVNLNALGLSVPGTLTVGTLSETRRRASASTPPANSRASTTNCCVR
jgi:polar amino acid transport system substrate-binding protein